MKVCVCALEINKSFHETEREMDREDWSMKNIRLKTGKTEEKLKREKEESVKVS